MSTTDVTQLRQRLEALLSRLQKFDNGLEKDLQSLEVAWARLDQVWGGHAYHVFSGSWNGVRQTLKEYDRLSHRYEEFLRERIEALEKFERSGDVR